MIYMAAASKSGCGHGPALDLDLVIGRFSAVSPPNRFVISEARAPLCPHVQYGPICALRCLSGFSRSCEAIATSSGLRPFKSDTPVILKFAKPSSRARFLWCNTLHR